MTDAAGKENSDVVIRRIIDKYDPRNPAYVDVTGEVCDRVDFEDVVKEDFKIDGLERNVGVYQEGKYEGYTFVSFTEKKLLGQKKLALIFDRSKESCQASVSTRFS